MTVKAMPHHLDSQRWEIGTSPGVWLTQCLMRTQESINPAVTKGAGKEQWQAKHMSSERVMAKWLPPHTRYLNSLSNWFLFRQLILQQDKVSRGWGPAGNEDCHVKTHKQSCTSKEEDKSKQFHYFKKKMKMGQNVQYNIIQWCPLNMCIQTWPLHFTSVVCYWTNKGGQSNEGNATITCIPLWKLKWILRT